MQPFVRCGLLLLYDTIAKQIYRTSIRLRSTALCLPSIKKLWSLFVVVWHQTNVKPPTSVLEQLTKRLSDTVQILTAFLFHSLHYVALRIALTSITCLPLQGLSTVNSVCPLSSQDSSSLNSNSPSETYVWK
jgi:hypothetical protein